MLWQSFIIDWQALSLMKMGVYVDHAAEPLSNAVMFGGQYVCAGVYRKSGRQLATKYTPIVTHISTFWGQRYRMDCTWTGDSIQHSCHYSRGVAMVYKEQTCQDYWAR